MFDNWFFFENRAIYEIMWKNCYKGGQATDKNMAHTLCLLDNHDYTNTHSEYVILFVFPLQRQLHERASVLHCFVLFVLFFITYLC
jgi:hypothetical protein